MPVKSLQVEVHFKSTAAGGRATPASLATGSYRPHFVVEPGKLLGVVFVRASAPMAAPGETTVATVALMYDGVDYAALVPGAVFDVVEGSRVVATGRVLPSGRGWLNANTEYEGFPIYFRRPDIKLAEFAMLQPRYPRLLLVTLHLRQVKENGLPESGYDDVLAALDGCLTSAFVDEADGLAALVETFAGKRTYYFYLTPSFDAEAFVNKVKAHFPHEDLSWTVHEDPSWKLLRGYAADFGFA